MKIGFIGTGRMGQGIAGRVLGAGHDLRVFNRTTAKTSALVQGGAQLALSVAAACVDREVVITMLADDAALSEVARADAGLLQSLPKGAIHVAMGTHSVELIRAMTAAHAAAGQTLVSAPVLGRPDLAAIGQVAVVAGGPPDAVARCRTLFEVIGRRTFSAGEQPVSAAAIKITNNFALGCAIEVMGEAFSLVRKYGVSAAAMNEVLTEGLFGAPAYKVYGKIIVDELYDQVGITALLGLKDVNLALAAAGAAGVPLPSANVWRDRLVGAIGHGDGAKDWSVMAREQARASGLDE